MTKRPHNRIEVAAYYFPNYHRDPRNEARYGPGWTEWEIVKAAQPRFEQHAQPKLPLWGYEDEALPEVFARKIAAAADHGIDAFIFDWYTYNDGEYLNRALDEGYLGAANHDRVKFALMWANHDWVDIFPAPFGQQAELLYPAAVTPETFERFTEDIIARYFAHPSYWKIEGKPYFSIFMAYRLVQDLGGLEAAVTALERFRQKTCDAGFPGLHLNAIVSGMQPPSTIQAQLNLEGAPVLARALRVDSVTPYVWLSHFKPGIDFPTCDYLKILKLEQAGWNLARTKFDVPFYPNVSMGWDATPRCDANHAFELAEYPFVSVLTGNTPQAFQQALEAAKVFAQEHAGPRFVTVNSWNEWTEGSYLEPDVVHGTAYLEALKAVFGSTPERT